MELRGVLGPVVTPFQSALGEVNINAFTHNVRAHMTAGLHGVVVAGSTGEAALLDDVERIRLVEAARREVPSDRLLLAGVGVESTRATVRLAQQAAAAGADAVLVVSPHYYTSAMTARALLDHFHRVADESPVPVVLYNIPKYVGFTIAPTLVGELAEHKNIIGIKDSSGDIDLLTVYINKQTDAFSVLTGSGSLFCSSLQSGARGGILAVALFAPELTLSIYRSIMDGDLPSAASLQARLTPMATEIVGTMGVPGVKSAMDAIGLAGGPVRAPLLPLSQPEGRRVRALLREGITAAV